MGVGQALTGEAGQVERGGLGSIALGAVAHRAQLDLGKGLVHVAGDRFVPFLNGGAKERGIALQYCRGTEPAHDATNFEFHDGIPSTA